MLENAGDSHIRAHVTGLIDLCPSGSDQNSIGTDDVAIGPGLPQAISITKDDGEFAGGVWVTGAIPIPGADGQSWEQRIAAGRVRGRREDRPRRREGRQDHAQRPLAEHDRGAATPAELTLDSPPGRWVLAAASWARGWRSSTAPSSTWRCPHRRATSTPRRPLQWILNGYLLTLASLILLGGSLGDRYGRRRIFVFGVGLFTVASLLCAIAPSASCSSAPAAAGRRWRTAHAREPGDDRGELPPRRPGAGDRRMVGAGRRRGRARAAARRLPRRGGLVAGDLPDQPADRDLRDGDGEPPRPRDPRSDGQRAARLPRRAAGGARPRRHDLRADRGPGRGGAHRR